MKILYDEALKLYRTLLEILKAPYLNALEYQDDVPTRHHPQPHPHPHPQQPMPNYSGRASLDDYTPNQVTGIVEVYLDTGSIEETSHKMR